MSLYFSRSVPGRLNPLVLLLILLAALSTATRVLDLPTLHFVFKPLTMLVAIILVAARAYASVAGARFDVYLMVALAASLAGDVFLMLPGNYFIPGLASFLVAHLFYIALFRQGVPWFPSRRALLSTSVVRRRCVTLPPRQWLGVPASSCSATR